MIVVIAILVLLAATYAVGAYYDKWSWNPAGWFEDEGEPYPKLADPCVGVVSETGLLTVSDACVLDDPSKESFLSSFAYWDQCQSGTPIEGYTAAETAELCNPESNLVQWMPTGFVVPQSSTDRLTCTKSTCEFRKISDTVLNQQLSVYRDAKNAAAAAAQLREMFNGADVSLVTKTEGGVKYLAIRVDLFNYRRTQDGPSFGERFDLTPEQRESLKFDAALGTEVPWFMASNVLAVLAPRFRFQDKPGSKYLNDSVLSLRWFEKMETLLATVGNTATPKPAA